MKKSILNFGASLSKEEQKNVFGGANLTKNDPNCDIAGQCCGPDFPCTRYEYDYTQWPPELILVQGTCSGGTCYY